MTSGVVARWLRRGEIGLSVLGVSLLGGALAAIVGNRVYQARQERAFSAMERRAAVAAGEATPAPAPSAAEGADPLVLGRIEIPRLGVSAIVREGDDDGTLAIAVGHIPGTARPGERGNMALAGHRDSFFRALQGIRRDDSIGFSTAARRFEYRVVSTEVVEPEETRVLDPTGEAVLTLVTCYPFKWVGHAPRRFIVRARLAPPSVTREASR